MRIVLGQSPELGLEAVWSQTTRPGVQRGSVFPSPGISTSSDGFLDPCEFPPDSIDR